MHMVCYVVQYHIHIVCMCGSQHIMQLFVGTKSFVHCSSEDWPITVITRELGISFGAIVFIAVREEIHTPSVPWVLCDRRDPDGGDT